MDNEVLRDQLQGVYDRTGSLTKEQVLDEARATDHPLHNQFEWDDAKAGEAHRLEQAAGLIRSVRIVYAVDEEGRNKTTRAFVSIRDPKTQQRSYEPTESVVMDPVRYAMLLADFRRDWQRFQARWKHLAEFHEVVTAEVSQEEVPQTG